MASPSDVITRKVVKGLFHSGFNHREVASLPWTLFCGMDVNYGCAHLKFSEKRCTTGATSDGTWDGRLRKTTPDLGPDWFEIRREREIGDKKRWRRRGRRRLRWEWWCEDPVCRMSQIKFLLLSCLFILQLCESNSTQKWGRLITFWMTPLYREPSKYVQKDPILCQTGFVANARHDYLGEPAQIPFSDVYIKEEFCNIDNREREKQFSVGSGKNPYSTIWKVLLLEGQD